MGEGLLEDDAPRHAAHCFPRQNIILISNDITKIWCGDAQPDMEAIQILCAMANHTVDYAKTLYKPVIPKDINTRIKALLKHKLPYFFIYAKDKIPSQVEVVNQCAVNRISGMIPNVRIKNKELSKAPFKYRDMMSNKNLIETDAIVAEYEALYKQFRSAFNNLGDESELGYMQTIARNQLSKIAGSPVQACDMLIHYLFKTTNSKRQRLFWICFADIVLANLKVNLSGTMYCADCGARVKRKSNNQKLCSACSESSKKQEKEIVCADCGTHFRVPSRSKNRLRCDLCQGHRNQERYKKYNERRK